MEDFILILFNWNKLRTDNHNFCVGHPTMDASPEEEEERLAAYTHCPKRSSKSNDE
ncbi:MAG TPA: hypothetical protein VF708_18400 [Pyrinomonadaceae bacterium]|jgi:hypothetical protein